MAVVKLVPQSKPRAARPEIDPHTQHLLHTPLGVCRGCASDRRHLYDLLYTDTQGHDWHADCYQAVMQTACPAWWEVGGKVLPFTGPR
jgi:hypothetical protein